MIAVGAEWVRFDDDIGHALYMAGTYAPLVVLAELVRAWREAS